ncbi:hypothetical protein [Gymnodinialimonas sp.]
MKIRFQVALSSLLCVALLSLSTHGLSAAVDGVQSSRFERTAALAREGDTDTRATFVLAALGQLALAYEEEAALALAEVDTGNSDPELVGWANAVRRYAQQFPLLIEDARDGFPVSIAVGGDNPVAITVAERTVILNHPRPAQQAVFEQAVIAEFCTANACSALVQEPGKASGSFAQVGPVRPSWAFDADGALCGHKGVRVRFPVNSDMGGARALCREFVQETVVLSNEVAWQVRHGVEVGWETLKVHPVPGQDNYRLQLNEQGDAVLAPIPMLSRNPELVDLIAPWMRDRVTGTGERTVDIPARMLGW